MIIREVISEHSDGLAGDQIDQLTEYFEEWEHAGENGDLGESPSRRDIILACDVLLWMNNGPVS